MGGHTTGPVPTSMDESFLVWSVQRGEPGAFRTFVERHEIQIFSLLTALIGDPARKVGPLFPVGLPFNPPESQDGFALLGVVAADSRWV